MDSKTSLEWEHPFCKIRCLCFKGLRYSNTWIKNILTLRNKIIWGTRPVKAQFQIKATDPYPPNIRRTDFGTLVVLTDILIRYINLGATTLTSPALTSATLASPPEATLASHGKKDIGLWAILTLYIILKVNKNITMDRKKYSHNLISGQGPIL